MSHSMTITQWQDHLLAIAELVGEQDDPGAAWESVNALKERAERAEQQLRAEREAHFSELAGAQERAKKAEWRVAELEANWSPIETAPRDQTAILAAHEKSKVRAVSWREEVGSPRYVRYAGDDGWYPTHWAPLPAAPDTQEGKEAPGEWTCQRCGETVPAAWVTYHETHEGCGGECR